MTIVHLHSRIIYVREQSTGRTNLELNMTGTMKIINNTMPCNSHEL